MRILFVFTFLYTVSFVPAYAFDACAPEATQSYQPVERYYTRGLLFKIEKCGTPPSYLFATLHSDAPEYNALVNRVVSVTHNADAAYFEITADNETNTKAAQAMRLPAGSDLKTIIGEELFAKAVAATAEKGFTAEALNGLTPWAVAVLLQLPPNRADGQVIDEKLQKLFEARRKQVAGLETVEDHFGIFTNLPQEKQIDMLREALEDMPESAANNQALETAYAGEDLKTIDRLGMEAFAEVDDPILRRYLETKLLTERNVAMAKRLESILPSGNRFVAVGAMHLPGNQGFIRLIEQQGYFVTPVDAPL